jgi:hypothetical protein
MSNLILRRLLIAELPVQRAAVHREHLNGLLPTYLVSRTQQDCQI